MALAILSPCRVGQCTTRRFLLVILLYIGLVAVVARCPQWRSQLSPCHYMWSTMRGGAAEQETLMSLQSSEDECTNQSLTNSTLSRGNETEPARQRRQRWFRAASETTTTEKIHKQRSRWFNLFGQQQVSIKDNKQTMGVEINSTLPEPINATATTENVSSSSVSSVSATTNRGGALVKEQGSLRLQNRFLPPTTKLFVEGMKSVQNIWWVNAWTAQLPTTSDEEEMARLQLETSTRRAEEQRKQSQAIKNGSKAKMNQLEPEDSNPSETVVAHNTNATIKVVEVKERRKTIETKEDLSKMMKSSSKLNQKRSKGGSSSNTTHAPSIAVHRPTKKNKRKQHFTIRLPANITAVQRKGAYISSGYVSALFPGHRWSSWVYRSNIVLNSGAQSTKYLPLATPSPIQGGGYRPN